jgi:hypothetical protein
MTLLLERHGGVVLLLAQASDHWAVQWLAAEVHSQLRRSILSTDNRKQTN